MAVNNPARIDIGKEAVRIVWTNITTADTGAPADISDLEQISVQVTSGGAGTAQVRVSNDGVNFVGLTATLTVGAAAPEAVGIQPLGVNAWQLDISAVAAATVSVALVGKKRGT